MTETRGIKLSNRIRYIAGRDEEGDVGMLILLGLHGRPTKIQEIRDRSEFAKFFASFSRTEMEQMDEAVSA